MPSAPRSPRSGGPALRRVAVPARRYGDFDTLLADFHQQVCEPATEEVVGELEWQGFRLIPAHRPETAAEQVQARDIRIAALEADAAKWAGKLDGQDTPYPGLLAH